MRRMLSTCAAILQRRHCEMSDEVNGNGGVDAVDERADKKTT